MAALCCFACIPLAGAGELAPDLDEFKVKRHEVFEFARKPQVKRSGDRVTIRFASKGYCDATVAIEDAKGRTLRHLASGVLGPNAPEPDRFTVAVLDANGNLIMRIGKYGKGLAEKLGAFRFSEKLIQAEYAGDAARAAKFVDNGVEALVKGL